MRHTSHTFFGTFNYGRPITIFLVTNIFKLLKFKWPNLRCQSQLNWLIFVAIKHCTSAALMLAWKVLFLESGDLKTSFKLGSNNSSIPSFIDTENPFSTSRPTLIRLHLILGTYNTFSMSVVFPSFLWIRMFLVPSFKPYAKW